MPRPAPICDRTCAWYWDKTGSKRRPASNAMPVEPLQWWLPWHGADKNSARGLELIKFDRRVLEVTKILLVLSELLETNQSLSTGVSMNTFRLHCIGAAIFSASAMCSISAHAALSFTNVICDSHGTVMTSEPGYVDC